MVMADDDSRKGVSYLTGEIIRYLDELHAPHDAAIQKAFEAPEKLGFPAIQVGRSEGRFLTLLMQMIGAKHVVEVGTLAGYSTILLARGLADGGHVWTVELDENHASVAQDNIDAAGLADAVSVLIGPAQEVLPELDTGGPLDAVFIDADKEHYPEYGRWAAQRLRPGGLMIGDNSLLFGELLRDDDRAMAMRRFHEETAQTFRSVNLPTPDGMLLGLRR
jgi:caffeoyl-CoA O-methyltransferase